MSSNCTAVNLEAVEGISVAVTNQSTGAGNLACNFDQLRAPVGVFVAGPGTGKTAAWAQSVNKPN